MEAGSTESNLSKARCSRKVKQTKYEHNAPEIRNWWYQLFDILETDAAIKPEKRLPLLREVFPQRILQKILSILSVQDEKFKEQILPPPAPVVHKFKPSKKKKIESESSLVLDTKKSIIDDKEVEILTKEVASKSSTTIRKRFGEKPVVKENPYLNFFKRPPSRAAIWRELPPLSLEDMTLSQKSDAIAKAIATEFVQWIKTLGGDQETSINVQSVIEMFEIASQTDSTTSLRVVMKSMPSVSQKVAEYMRVPQMSKTLTLHNEIIRDKLATKRKSQMVAFGRRLPSEMQTRPLDPKQYRKWHKCETVPEKIASMAAVWQGITHLRSTKAFCEFIYYEKPEIPHPKYLSDAGMMDPKSFCVKQDSNQFTTDSFGDLSRLANMLNESSIN